MSGKITQSHLGRLTLLVPTDDILRIKHIAVDRRISTSAVIREALHGVVVASQKAVDKEQPARG